MALDLVLQRLADEAERIDVLHFGLGADFLARAHVARESVGLSLIHRHRQAVDEEVVAVEDLVDFGFPIRARGSR